MTANATGRLQEPFQSAFQYILMVGQSIKASTVMNITGIATLVRIYSFAFCSPLDPNYKAQPSKLASILLLPIKRYVHTNLIDSSVLISAVFL
jgi:hypothetical protein